MTRFEQFDAALKAKGWRYVPVAMEFRDGERVLNWEELIGLVPDFTLDDVASYAEDRTDKFLTRPT